jgi:hypothetical protein
MKQNLLITIALLGITIGVSGQKVVNKTITPKSDKVTMKLDFATRISVEAWSQNTIELSVSANIDDNKYNDFYSLTADGAAITEKIDWDGIKAKEGKKNFQNFETEIVYTLKVPQGLNFSLNTISGEIELKGCEGEMEVKSVSGFIDYTVPTTHKMKMNLSTVTGDIYSNVKFDSSHKKEMNWVGSNKKLSLNGGTLPVELATVSGDIYLRKQ